MKFYNTWFETGYPSMKDFGRAFDLGETQIWCRVKDIPTVENDLIYSTTDEGRPGQYFPIPSTTYKVGMWQNIAMASVIMGEGKTGVAGDSGIFPIKDFESVDTNFEPLSKYGEKDMVDAISGRKIAGGEQGIIGTGTGDFKAYKPQFWSLGPLICDSKTSIHSQAWHTVTGGIVDEDNNTGMDSAWDIKVDLNKHCTFAYLQKGNTIDDVGYGFQMFAGDPGGQTVEEDFERIGPKQAPPKPGASVPAGGGTSLGKGTVKHNITKSGGGGNTLLAYMSWLKGGHHCGGHLNDDAHKIGENIYGESIQPDHVWVDHLVYCNKILDGPWDFEKRIRPYPSLKGTFRKLCKISFSAKAPAGVWYVWTKDDFTEPTPPGDTPELPKTPSDGVPIEGFDPIDEGGEGSGEGYIAPVDYSECKAKIGTGYQNPFKPVNVVDEGDEFEVVSEMRTDKIIGARGFTLLGAPFGIYTGQIGYNRELNHDFNIERVESLPAIGSIDYISATTLVNEDYVFDYDLEPEEYQFKGGTADGMVYVSAAGLRHWARPEVTVSDLNWGFHEDVSVGWLKAPDIDGSLHNKDSIYFKPYDAGAGKLDLELIGEDAGGVRVCTTRLKACNFIVTGAIGGHWTRDAAQGAIFPTNVTDDVFLPDNYGIEFGGTTAANKVYMYYQNATNKFKVDVITPGDFIEHIADRLEFSHRGTGNIFQGIDAGKDCAATAQYNVAIGDYCMDAGAAFANSVGNTAAGYQVLSSLTTGDDNTFVGRNGAWLLADGSYNVGFGSNTLARIISGNFCTAVGMDAGFNMLGSNSTHVGRRSGYTNQNGDGVYLGYAAGYFETAANKFFIDNVARANEADGRLKALMYGKFDALTSNQELHVNANLYTPDDLYHYFGDPAAPDAYWRWDNGNSRFQISAPQVYSSEISTAVAGNNYLWYLDNHHTPAGATAGNTFSFYLRHDYDANFANTGGDGGMFLSARNIGGNTLAYLYGIQLSNTTGNTSTTTRSYGGYFENINYGINTYGTAGFFSTVNLSTVGGWVMNQYAVDALCSNEASGDSWFVAGVRSSVRSIAAGAVMNSAHAFYASAPLVTAGQINNFYGIYIVHPVAATNNYPIYVADGINESFLGGHYRIPDDRELRFGAPDVSLKWDNANSKFQIDAGSNFIEHVAERLELDHRGTDNIFIGKDTGKDCGAAIRNTGIGDYVFDAGITFIGDDNVGVGYGAGGKITGGQHNTLAGVYAGANITDGLDDVFLGYKAGHYGNPSNTFYLDNRDRANEAGQQANSLIHGLFGADANAQDIYFNANLHLKHDNIEFYFGAGTDSKIYFNGSALVIETGGVTNTDDILLTTAANGQVLLAQSGSSGTPSFAFNSSVALGLYRANNTTMGVSQNLFVKEDVEVGEFFRMTKTGAAIAADGSIVPLSSNIELTSVNDPDDLDTISGGNDEDIIVFQKGTPVINVRDASTGVGGNIHLDGQVDFQFNSVYDRLVLQRHGDDEWVEISRSNNT